MTWVSLALLAHIVPVSVSDAKSGLMAVVDVIRVPPEEPLDTMRA